MQSRRNTYFRYTITLYNIYIYAPKLFPNEFFFQINAEAPRASERFPVDITVRQFGRMIAFQLPTIERREGELVYSSTEKALDLCPLDHIETENSTVTVSISSDSIAEVEVSIRVRVKGRGIEWRQTEDSKYVCSVIVNV